MLLHITSLPGDYGVGDLGPEAHRFVADIAAAGQRYWQLLPVVPTGAGNSPYSSTSTFGGNPLLISPQSLRAAGLIEARELEDMRLPASDKVDYGLVYREKMSALHRAAGRFSKRASGEIKARFEAFRLRNGSLWLDDFSLYEALKHVHGFPPARRTQITNRLRLDLSEEVETQRVVQFLFFEQWSALRSTCADHGIELVGDLPLYVALDSADVWANPGKFLLGPDGRPTVVAGVPPDYFSETGQLWGNPIYDWEAMASSGFSWWRARVRHATSMFDVLRIDHFRGIAGYWEVPATEETAVNGRWCPGPGALLLSALEDEIGRLPLIAEDLGVITDDVVALRDGFGLPGMRVAQFGFDDVADSSMHHPDVYPENVWAYTGTHDNDTTLGWFWDDNPRHRWWRLPKARRRLHRAVGGDVAGGLVAWVARSRANTVVFPVQDILRLGSEARMNLPGTPSGNWEWRLQSGQLADDHLYELLSVTREAGRT